MKMKFKIISFIVILFVINLLLSNAQAQNKNQQENVKNLLDTSKTITVTGDAEIKFDPDYYEIEIEFNDGNCKKGESIETILEKIMEIIKSNKVNIDSLKLIKVKKQNDFLINKVLDNVIEIRVYNIKTQSKNLYKDLADEALYSQLFSCKLKELKNTKLQAYKLSLYEKAMKDALYKAEIITNFNGQKIETVLKIDEYYLGSNYNEDIISNMTGGIDIEFKYHLDLEIKVIFKVK